MEQSRYLIDTNAVIDYLGQKLPSSGMTFMNGIVDAIPSVSVITKIEVLGFNAPDEHYQLLTGFMNDSAILSLTDDIIDACIGVRKQQTIKLPDAIIAARALVHGLVLVSRNTSDFKKIPGLNVLNPHEL